MKTMQRHKARMGLLLAAMVSACLIAGCGAASLNRSREQALRLTEEGRWGEAMPYAKAALLARPGDVPGHFLLGQCYLHATPPRFALAQGELRTAHALCLRTGEWQGLPQYGSLDEFKAGVAQELAKVFLGRTRMAIEVGMPRAYADAQLEQVKKLLKRAGELQPEAATLPPLREDLALMLKKVETMKPGGLSPSGRIV